MLGCLKNTVQSNKHADDELLFPSIDIFKIAMLNKELHHFITELFKPLKLSDFGKYHGINSAISMFSSEPEFVSN